MAIYQSGNRNLGHYGLENPVYAWKWKNMTEEKKKPVKSIRVGCVKASIWENKAESGQVFFSVGIQRSYKDTRGEWQNSDSYPLNDLKKLELAASKAYEWILLESKEKEE